VAVTSFEDIAGRIGGEPLRGAILRPHCVPTTYRYCICLRYCAPTPKKQPRISAKKVARLFR